MKRMQCEACGSSDIRKISDDIFECQSCGVQYEKSQIQKLLVEIDGEVKIDHSGEIENLLKRAEQFLKNGNWESAKEYYSKVLDIDAENSMAIEGHDRAVTCRKIELARELIDCDLRDYDVIEPKVDVEEGFEAGKTLIGGRFEAKIGEALLKQLKGIKNISCDIYKEISIKSVSPLYVPFVSFEDEYEIDWSATACHRHYENQTIWVDNKPQVKSKEIIERVPRSGTQPVTAKGFTYASNKLYNDIVKRIGGEPQKVREMLLHFEKRIFAKLNSQPRRTLSVDMVDMHDFGMSDDKLGSIGAKAKEGSISIEEAYKFLRGTCCLSSVLDPRKMIGATHQERAIAMVRLAFLNMISFSNASFEPDVTKSVVLSHKKIPLDLLEDEASYEDVAKAAYENAEAACLPQIRAQIGGDFCENVHVSATFREGKRRLICFPIQYIEYIYKGKTYVAISDLTSTDEPMIAIFPCNSELTAAKETFASREKQAAKMPAAFWLSFVVLILAVILSSTSPAFTVIGALISVVLMLSSIYIRSKHIKKLEADAGSLKETLYRPKLNALLKSYDAFWDAFDEAAFEKSFDLKKANAAAAAECLEVPQVHSELFAENALTDITAEDLDASNDENQIKELEKELKKRKRLRNLGFALIGGFLYMPLSMSLLTPIFGEEILNNMTVLMGFVIVGIIISVTGIALSARYVNKAAATQAQLKKVRAEWMKK